MATLILTTVGTVVGGPIGGALGAMAGRAIDGAILRPGARQGPRLNELGVQTSSYGTQIPRLFGTMRVAGTVIWSTDLIETQSRDGGGKGAPDAVRYNYAASFAVLLSARPIRAVRRIWAEGKLLRGAAGDFKVRTGFRLYGGEEGQTPDPLIASAVGIARAPAMRGQAYAVFENMALADFGNRIPSLTFEVEADAGAVEIGAVAGEIGDVAPGGALSPVLDGFSAYGGSRRAVLEMLAEASGGWFAPRGDRLEMRVGLGDALTVEDAGSGGPTGVRQIAAADQAPRVVTVGHYDAARDYQAGLQRATRPGAGVRARHAELPAVLDAATAKHVATAMLARADAERVRRRVSIGWEGLAIGPGDRVRVAGDDTLWRVTGWNLERMAVELELSPIALATASAAASPGEIVGAPDVVHGRTLIVAAELPPLDDTLPSRPVLTVVAAGAAPGWRGATLMASEDGGVSWTARASLKAHGVIGRVVAPPGLGLAAIEDHRNALVVELAHEGMNLTGADRAALDAGTNLALVGNELIQFGRAEQLSLGRWRLSRLWRGRRGTEWAIGGHAQGERFALLRQEDVTLLPIGAIGGTVRLAASGLEDGDTLDPVTAPVDGASVLPPSPVHLRVTRNGDETRLGWVWRSRAGWAWRDGVDVPLVEERAQWRVRLGKRAIETGVPHLVVPEVSTAAEVVQLGTFGPSRPARINLYD